MSRLLYNQDAFQRSINLLNVKWMCWRHIHYTLLNFREYKNTTMLKWNMAAGMENGSEGINNNYTDNVSKH